MLLRSTALALSVGALLATTDVQAATFNEGTEDAGDLIGTAADVGGGINVIIGNNADNDVDVYKLYLGAGDFEAEVTEQGADMALALFDSNGIGLRADDDSGGGLRPKVSATLTEGLYYLAIFPILSFVGPVSETDRIWNDVLDAVNSEPNGLGADNPWIGWQLVDESNPGSDGGSYRIALNQMTLAQEQEPSIAVIPLPAGLPLLLTALGGLAFLRQRRRDS